MSRKHEISTSELNDDKTTSKIKHLILLLLLSQDNTPYQTTTTPGWGTSQADTESKKRKSRGWGN